MDISELAGLLESVDPSAANPADFQAACTTAAGLDLEDDRRLILYGLFKQTLSGDAKESPSESDIVAYAKWRAWKGFSGFPQKNAMAAYVFLVNNFIAQVRESAEGSLMDRVGPVCSTLINKSDSSAGWEEGEEIFAAAVNDDIEALKRIKSSSFISSSNSSPGFDVNSLSKEGLSALHYAADRGHISAVRFLVEEMRADVDVFGAEGETALDLALACEQTQVADYLGNLRSTKIEN